MGRKEKPCICDGVTPLSIGIRMRVARHKKGVSVTELAKRLGYASSYLSGVETDKKKPSQNLLEGYKRELRLGPDELIK